MIQKRCEEKERNNLVSLEETVVKLNELLSQLHGAIVSLCNTSVSLHVIIVNIMVAVGGI
jgi:hypothetical protein